MGICHAVMIPLYTPATYMYMVSNFSSSALASWESFSGASIILTLQFTALHFAIWDCHYFISHLFASLARAWRWRGGRQQQP